MKIVLWIISFITLSNFSACDPNAILGPTFNRSDPANLRVTYGEGACFGNCEVFTLEVYNNGLLVRKGERNTDKPGVWQNSIDRRTVTSFIDSLNRINFSQYPAVFPSRLPDLAATTITWYDGAQQPTQVSFKEETSPELRRLADRLKQLAALPGYRQYSETLDDGRVPTAKGEKEEIIVHLKPEVAAEDWALKYGKQDVRLVERIAPNGNYYLITSNPNIMGAEELLKFIRQDVDVVSAQMNGTVSPR